MATAINKKLRSLKRMVALFSDQQLACRENLHTMDGFPLDIWKKMGKANLLGVGIPTEYGGLGENYLAMTVTGETLVARGHNLGIAISWLTHHAVACFLVLGFGNRNQKERILSKMALGKQTASFAVSEPGTGAHPKHLKTMAHFKGDRCVLNGEKAYLTNGPIADFFVVIAVNEDHGGRKRFTAFLVPKDVPGLTVTEPWNLDYLRPSPHCGIKLRNCSVPASTVLGKAGSAYEDMVKPFR